MRPLADGLRALGVDVWFDERLQPDRSFTEEITHVIGSCQAQLVCWSPAAVTSEWVRGEAEKGRQRGVLIATIIEPCDLPPPFNMHHAENLVGWSGDARHSGWCKIAEAVGRKLNRPGLGELAALQVSDDAAAWKKWAQKHPNDPQADGAWARAEELEIGAARARMARDRDAAKRAAEEAGQRRITQPPRPPRRVETPQLPPGKPGLLPVMLSVVAVGAVVGVAGWYISTQTENRSAPPQVAIAETTMVDEAPTEVVLPETTPPQTREPAAPPVSTDPATPALTALSRIRPRDWWNTYIPDMLRRVVGASSLESLNAAALTDARAQTLLANAHIMERSRVGEDPYGLYDQDYSEAIRLYRLAAAQGFAPAQEGLAERYVYGQGVPRDNAEAYRWYRLAANQGYATSQMALGFAYERGIASAGITEDRNEAVRLLRLAARQGEMNARSSLEAWGESW